MLCVIYICITSREPKRDHFGAVAVDVHRMFHHDSTVPTAQASGLGWISAGLPHIQGVHRNLHTNPVNPSSPLQKPTRTVTLHVSQMFGFVPLNEGYTVSVRTARLNVLVLLTLALAGE